MGECVYYIKAKFPKEQLKKVKKQIEAFWKEGQKCYMDWQDARENKNFNREKFWAEYEKKYPLVCDYLKHAKKFGGDLDKLTGLLDFGSEDQFHYTGREFCFSDVAWHFADWSPVAQYLKDKFGASRVVYTTEEEGCGSIDDLQFYDYEQIIEDILKRKKLLPLLLHINNELDEMIKENLRGNIMKRRAMKFECLALEKDIRGMRSDPKKLKLKNVRKDFLVVDGETVRTIEVNDNSYLYYNKTKRDKDYKKLTGLIRRKKLVGEE